MFVDAYALFEALEAMNLLDGKPPLWWPGYGTFEVVVGAVLTQNSQWTRVERSLENLRGMGVRAPEAFMNADTQLLMEAIRPSGLFKNKTKVLQMLCGSLVSDFGDFVSFQTEVTREWLLSQKGIGPETADSILCYACGRDAMVVDAYTARLLEAFGYAFEHYDDLQAWCVEGIAGQVEAPGLPETYARFHGMIVEYVKRHKKGKNVDVAALSLS